MKNCSNKLLNPRTSARSVSSSRRTLVAMGTRVYLNTDARGDGWFHGAPSQGASSGAAVTDDGDIDGPPADEGVVDEAQQERDDSETRNKYNYGKGGSKGAQEQQICWKYREGWCKYGDGCRFSHDRDIPVEGHRDPGRRWDDGSRQALREAGLHKVCFDHHLRRRCRVGYYCSFSHDELSSEKLATLQRVVHLANRIKGVQDKGGEVPNRVDFPMPNVGSSTTGQSGATGGAASSSSGAPSANTVTNVSNQNSVAVETGGAASSSAGVASANAVTSVSNGTVTAVETSSGAMGQDGDVQADTTGAVNTAPIIDGKEPVESWMACGFTLRL